MSVLFVEGFTGYPRESGLLSTGSSLLSGGYLLPTAVNTSTGPSPAGQQYSIIADPVFSDRNLLRMQSAQSTTSTMEMGINVGHGLATNPAKSVLGFTMTVNTPAAAKYAFQVIIGSAYNSANPQNALFYTNTGGNRTTQWMSEAFAQISFNDTNTASPNGGITVPGNATAAGAVGFTPNVQHHVELLLEQDVNRIRMYLDGVLVGDGSFPGVLANMNSGFCIATKRASGAALYVDVGNIYHLAVDSVHTGVLGPATRVIEVIPASDAVVQWSRDESKYSSDTAVIAQTFNGTDFLMAMDAGTTDLFNMPSSVGSNASQVYGMAIKVAAKSLTDATHALKATVKVNGVSVDSTEWALPLNTTAVMVRDASINPNTNTVWKPSEISTGQFGFKLSK